MRFVVAVLAFALLAGLARATRELSSNYYGRAQVRATEYGASVYPNLGGVAELFYVSQEDPSSDVILKLTVDGLTVGSSYAVHIHQYGDALNATATAGTHFSTEAHPAHGCWPATERHVGDIGNITITSSGPNVFYFQRSLIDLSGTEASVIGRSILIHAKPDTCVQPTGAAGVFIAQGIIGIGNPSLSTPAASFNNASQRLQNVPLSAVAFLYPTATVKSNIRGYVQFATTSTGLVRVTASVQNMPASLNAASPGLHAMHIHQYGHEDPTNDGTLAGGHYNPYGEIHAPPTSPHRHYGDLGNFTFTLNPATGLWDGTFDRTFDLIALTGSYANIIGHGVVLHAQRDDGNPSQDPKSTGDAAARWAVGVIGISGRKQEDPTISPIVIAPSTGKDTEIMRQETSKENRSSPLKLKLKPKKL